MNHALDPESRGQSAPEMVQHSETARFCIAGLGGVEFRGEGEWGGGGTCCQSTARLSTHSASESLDARGSLRGCRMLQFLGALKPENPKP